MKVQISLALAFLSILNVVAQDSKENVEFKDRFYLSQGNNKYNLILADYTNMYQSPFLGLSYKRAMLESEYWIALLAGYSLGLEYGKVDESDCLNFNAETSMLLFPYTLVFKLGAGTNVLSNFEQNIAFSAAPIIGIDIGTAELTYSRNITMSNSFEQNVSKHSLRLKFGLWTNYKSAH